MTTGSKLSGPYFLMNLQSETILDCDWKCKEIIGAKLHGRPSQQWQFAPSGEGYTIHNLLTTKQYLTVREKVHDKGKVMASSFPVEWAVSRTQNDEEDCIRIGWAGTDSVVNLADGGSAKEGAKVELTKQQNETCEIWRCLPASISISAAPWPDGSYFLINASTSSMALELLEDKKTLVGSLFHGGSSQQWRFSRSGSGYTVQNASATGLYMRVEDNICDTAKVVVAPFLASWNVQVDGEINGTGTLTIRWPETNYVLDLAESGTKVQLSMTSKNDNPCQTWRFIQLQFHRLDRRQRALNLSSRLGVSH